MEAPSRIFSVTLLLACAVALSSSASIPFSFWKTAAGGGGFVDPTSIAGLRLWLKADALGLSDGTAVSSWTDSSGSANHATQGTGANQPTFKTAILNLKPIIRFDGTNDQLIVPSTSTFNFTDATIFVVRNNQATAAVVSIAVVGTHNSEFLVYNKAIYHHTSNTNHVTITHQDSPSGFFVQAGVFGAATTDLGLWLNGVATTQSTTSSGFPGAYTTADRAGYVGGRYDMQTGERFNGDIAEIIVYDSKLSTTNRQNVEDYLGTKYAITITH